MMATATGVDGEPRLIGSPVSPFSLRVSLAASAKRVKLGALPLPAGGLRCDAFLAINPVGKIPVLIVEGDLALAESSVILEYLEDRHPHPALLPLEPAERAHMRLVAALVDRYFMAPVIRLFPHLDPCKRNDEICADEVARWVAGLGYLEEALARPLASVEAQLSFADCILAPSFHLGTRIAAMIGLARDPITGFTRLTDLYATYKRHPILGPALTNLTEQQSAKDTKAGLPSVSGFH